MVKGKYGNRTRRRIKGGNSSTSVMKSGTYGFGQNRLINPKPKTIWSREKYFGFTPPVGDINVDNYNDATLFEDDDNATLFDSASKKGSKKISLPKTSVWDKRVDYLKQMTQYIESQNNMITNLQENINKTKETNKGKEEINLVSDLDANIRDMTNMVKKFERLYIADFPTREKDAKENLGNIFRDQINLLMLADNIKKIIYKIEHKNEPKKISKKPWWNITRKNKGKTGAAEPPKLLEIIQLIKKTSYGRTLPHVKVEEIAATLEGQTRKNVKKGIKKLTVKSTRA